MSTQSVTSKPWPWRTVALVSLAFNLAIGGVLVGGYMAGARFAPPHQMAQGQDTGRVQGQGPTRAFIQAMPREKRGEARRAFTRAFIGAKAQREESRAARLALAEAAVAEPYDPAKVSAALERIRVADMTLQKTMHDVATELLNGLDAAERRDLARALARPGRPDRDRRGGAREEGRGPPREGTPPPP
jgi:uncharacterized membrane protein